MEHVARLFAGKLLQISAVNLQPDNCFIWANGWNAPLYTDMRKLLSYPALRTFVKLELSRLIMEHFPEVEAIAGVATGAIAVSALVADELGMPYAYVRTKPKDHGLENLIEGNLKPGLKVMVVNDLLTNASRSRRVAETLRDAGCEVVGMVAIFSYEFPVATKAFKEANVKLITLSNYTALITAALETGFIREKDVDTLREWRKDPSIWSPGEAKAD